VSESDLRFLMAAMLSICVIQMKHKELERREKELTIREMLNNSESSLVDLRQVGIRWCTAARQQHSKHAYANRRMPIAEHGNLVCPDIFILGDAEAVLA